MVDIWRTDTVACIQTLSVLDEFYFCALAFSPDEKLLYLVTEEHTLFAWNTDTWESERRINLSAPNAVNPRRDEFDPTIDQMWIAFSIDARLICLAYVKRLELYKVNTGQCLRYFKFKKKMRLIAFSHNLSQCLTDAFREFNDITHSYASL